MARAYVEIKKDEFERAMFFIKRSLESQRMGFVQPIQLEGVEEYVYEVSTSRPDIRIVIYSSIDKRTNVSRNSGEDAIRLVALFKNNFLFDKKTHTKRIENWENNLFSKLKELLNDINGVPVCPKCGAVMVQRAAKAKGTTKKNVFWGCSNFPNCKGTRNL